MKSVKALVLALCILAPCRIAAAQVQANTWDELTYFTFAAPVEVPGKALPAGTYVFKLLDSYSSCDIVRILSPDRTKVYATILAIPDYRRQPTDKTVIRFAERPADSPEAIQAWFFPGMQYGHQFVYPKTAAAKPARFNARPAAAGNAR